MGNLAWRAFFAPNIVGDGKKRLHIINDIRARVAHWVSIYSRLITEASRAILDPMQQVSASPLPIRDAAPVAQLHGRWRLIARAAWYIVAALACAWLIASIPAYLFSLGIVTPGEREGVDLLGSLALFSPSPTFEFWMDLSVMVTSLGASVLSLALAVLLFRRKPNDVMAWLVSFTLLLYGVIMTGPAEFVLGYVANAFALALAAQGLMWIPFMLLFFVFPTGAFVPRWTRWLALLLLPFAIVLTYFSLAPTALMTTVFFAFMLTYTAVSLCAPAALIYRYARTSDRIQRLQIKWVGFGIALLVFAGTVLPTVVLWLVRQYAPARVEAGLGLIVVIFLGRIAWWAGLFALPLCFTIAILRYRLFDINLILNRTLVYGSLTFAVVGIFILVSAALGALFQVVGGGSNLLVSLLATAAIAILFQPLRERLQRGVNRLTYGERDDPYVVLTRLGAQLESAMEPSSALTQTVETVASALKLPYVAIALKRDDAMQTAAAHGTAPKVVSGFPLVHAGEPIGELVAAPRTPNEGFTPADERLLRDLARQISIAARTVALTSDLEQARLRIVTERGEARRQLGSDLHDGVGHQLVALTRQIERAKSTNSSTEISSEFLADIQQRLVAITTQVRSLAHQLYPPELEVLGLSGALRERVHTYPTFRISIDAPETFPRLPAEIETAAYYIALEALTNVDKHAHANVCSIRLRLSIADAASPLQRLEMDIVDDGRGMTASETHGLGLLSMRARAAEVGGSCDIAPNPGGGTAVRVRIPCVLKAA
jgi:signal transduction histidine kinase